MPRRRRRRREVDQAVILEAAIVDFHDDPAAVVEVDDFGIGRQRQGLVRRGRQMHVVGLAAGSPAAVELAAVPRRGAALAITFAAAHDVVLAAENLVRRMVAVAGQRLNTRRRVGHSSALRPLLEDRPPALDPRLRRAGTGRQQQAAHEPQGGLADGDFHCAKPSRIASLSSNTAIAYSGLRL
jgi:hypothetical protein